MRLVKDISSSKLSKGIPVKIYGKRGESISVISEHGDVLIVKGSGEAFSVHKDFVSN